MIEWPANLPRGGGVSLLEARLGEAVQRAVSAGPDYSPGDRLAAFTRARRCRFPGCRAPAIRCDLDHNIPWPAGTTSEANLARS